MFLEDARSGLQEVEEALQRGDAPAVERVAHKLIGGPDNMGAKGMSCFCAQSEDIEISREAPSRWDESGRS